MGFFDEIKMRMKEKKDEIVKNTKRDLAMIKSTPSNFVKNAKRDLETIKSMPANSKKSPEERQAEFVKRERGKIHEKREEAKEVYQNEILNSRDQQVIVEYIGSHPDLVDKTIGELTLTKKELIFNELNNGHWTKRKIEMPLKKIVKVDYLSPKVETEDVATGLVKYKILGGWSWLARKKSSPTIVIVLKDKGREIGIAFELGTMLSIQKDVTFNKADSIGQEWKNNIVSAVYKAK